MHNIFHITKSQLYFFIPALILLCPVFPTYMSMGPQLVFLLNIAILIWAYINRVYSFKSNPTLKFFFGYYLVCTIIDIFFDTTSQVATPTDFLELLRPFGLLLFYFFYRNSYVSINKIERFTIFIIIGIFILESIYCITEYIIPDKIRPISYILWKRESLPILKNKAIGTFSQTYNFAFILLIPYIYSLISLFVHHRIKDFLLFTLFLSTILLTQSRSMYICVGIATFICFLLPINYRSLKSTMIVITTLTIITSMVTYLFITYYDMLSQSLSYAFSGFESMTQGSNSSVNTRKEQIDWVLDNNQFIFIGNGIGKSQIMLESFYALYYYRYGLLGVLMYIALILITAHRAYYICRHTKFPAQSIEILYYTLFVFYVIAPISLISSCHQDTPKISLIFYGLIGLVFAKYRIIKLHRKCFSD